MSNKEKTLETCSTEIAAFAARAMELQKAWESADDETKQREAVKLAEEARNLHVTLEEVMRSTFAEDDQR